MTSLQKGLKQMLSTIKDDNIDNFLTNECGILPAPAQFLKNKANRHSRKVYNRINTFLFVIIFIFIVFSFSIGAVAAFQSLNNRQFPQTNANGIK